MVWILDHKLWSVLGAYFIYHVHWFFHFCVFSSSSADVKGLLGTFHRCDHIDRVQVKGHRSSTFLRPRVPAQVGPQVGTFSALYIIIDVSTQQTSYG